MSNERKSLPKEMTLHGITIKKMPCGKYFQAMETLKELPKEFMKEICGNNKDFKLSEMFTMENITELVTKLLIIAPEFILNFLSQILDVDIDTLKNEVTPKELADVCKKFWEINELESFFDQMKPIQEKIITLIGFKK